MSAIPGLTKRVPAPTSRNNSQPGQGAPTGGAGRDTPGAGKDRGQFEKDRQRERGTGIDRPPVYSPPTDYRGGYSNRSAPTIPAPKKIPPLTPAGRSIPGSSAVHGMIPQY